MKAYSLYKDSGMEWIGQIPSHWGVLKIKSLCTSIFAGATPSTSVEEYWNGDLPWIPSGCCHDCLINEAPKFITKAGVDNSSTKLIPAYNTVMAMTGATCAQLGFVTFDTYANQSVAAFVANPQKVVSKFLFYALFAARNYVLSFQTGGAQAGINIDECSNLIVPDVPYNEQMAIVRYLDHAVDTISQIILEKESQYKEVVNFKKALVSEIITKHSSMPTDRKNTGCPYIPSVPNSWSCIPLKYLLKENMTYGANESAESDDKTFPRYIRITDITDDGGLRDETFKSLSPEKAKDYMLEPGDILFARSGATVGKAYLYQGGFDACYAGYLIRARCGEKLLPEFLFIYTQTSMYDDWKNSVYIQATIPNIGADKFSELRIPVPPVDEQRKIVKLVEQKSRTLNKLQDELKTQIEDLYIYRDAVISEAITGKIKCFE